MNQEFPDDQTGFRKGRGTRDQITNIQGFPGSSDGKASAYNAGDLGLIPWRRKWQPTPVFMPGKAHGPRSLVGYSPWGRKELDMTERLHFHYCIIEQGRKF